MELPVTGRPYGIFVEELGRLAVEVADPRVTDIQCGLAAPLRIAVHGRPGVGGGTVARALRAAGQDVSDDRADIDVFVVAEVVKPEDRAAITASVRPKVVVLNKADLSGFGPGGPMAAAAARCSRYHALTGVPTVPMVALLAVAEVDDELLGGLRLLAAEPIDLGSTDGFVVAPHRLPVAVRLRLLEALDLFGIAHAVLALRNKPRGEAAAVQHMLRRRSGLIGVIESLPVAEAGYRRTRAAVAALEAMMATAEPAPAARISDFLSSDDTVIALMAAAADVVAASGLDIGRGGDAHLRRAVHWQRYSRGPVNGVHRACGADIARGSLRLLRNAARSGAP